MIDVGLYQQEVAFSQDAELVFRREACCNCKIDAGPFKREVAFPSVAELVYQKEVFCL